MGEVPLYGRRLLTLGYRESRRCSRDTYPESYITEYTSIRRLLTTRGGQISRMTDAAMVLADAGADVIVVSDPLGEGACLNFLLEGS